MQRDIDNGTQVRIFPMSKPESAAGTTVTTALVHNARVSRRM
jgi:hypothetical protein